MSDYDSSLPVRTENPGDVVAKIADASVPSQQLAVDAAGKIGTKLSDGAGNALTSTDNTGKQSLDVNITGNEATPPFIDGDAFAYGTDTVTPVSGVHNDVGATLGAGETGALRLTAERGLHTNLRDAAGAELVGQKAMAASVPVVFASDQSDLNVRLHDAAGAPFTPNNPLPVSFSDSPGDEINDYDTAGAIAGGASDNHDYTVTAGKVLFLTQVSASASGKAKVEIQIETGAATDVFVTRFVQFNSTATPNMEVLLREPIQVAAGVRVRVIRTNRDNQAQDLYSTISGHEI